jgi:hypothetical protein
MRTFLSGIFVLFIAVLTGCAADEADTEYVSKPYDLKAMYDENGLQPSKVTPSDFNLQENVPSDAIILFDGTDLSRWVDKDGNPAQWKVGNGYMEVVEDAGEIFSKKEFGSCQLHIEWATPETITDTGQDRGNSGVYLMSRYEVQVLDSYNNTTYPAGMAASVYGQSPPMVNASRAPGEWQSYDIVFRRPVFKNGKVVRPAVVTVFHNGILVQDHFEIMGPTVFKKVPKYKAHPEKQPISLQEHENPVRYRNIWVRELPPE